MPPPPRRSGAFGSAAPARPSRLAQQVSFRASSSSSSSSSSSGSGSDSDSGAAHSHDRASPAPMRRPSPRSPPAALSGPLPSNQHQHQHQRSHNGNGTLPLPDRPTAAYASGSESDDSSRSERDDDNDDDDDEYGDRGDDMAALPVVSFVPAASLGGIPRRLMPSTSGSAGKSATNRDDTDGSECSEYTDTDDDDFSPPQLPLTDSRGERIVVGGGAAASLPNATSISHGGAENMGHPIARHWRDDDDDDDDDDEDDEGDPAPLPLRGPSLVNMLPPLPPAFSSASGGASMSMSPPAARMPPAAAADPWAAYRARQSSERAMTTPIGLGANSPNDPPVAAAMSEMGGTQGYAPLPWAPYFRGGALDVHVPAAVVPSHAMAGAIRDTDVFRTYWTASEDLLPATCPPPSLLATDVGSGAFPPSSLPTAPANLFVMIHGAGQGALSYAVTASLLAGQHPNSVVMAMDLRNHGHSRAADPVHAPMSRAQLASDVAAVVCGLYPSLDPALKPAFHDEEVGPKDVVLVGHSLGGAVAAHMAAFEKPPMLQHLLGLVVLDVVEGTAIEALPGMRGIVSARPGVFPSMDAAVQWILETGQVNNASSARVSVPAQLVPVSPSSTRVRWVTDLMATEPFWQDWFAGLSSLFLRAPAAKLLILAGTDRLDRELTIGQMQGKFQMEVLQAVGHNLHEDAPSATAHLLSQFANRNARLVLPPKFNGTRAAPPPAAAATTAAAGASAVRPVSIPKLSAPRSHMSEGGGGDGGDM